MLQNYWDKYMSFVRFGRFWQKQVKRNQEILLPESALQANWNVLLAKEVLRNLTIADLRNHPAVPYEIDFVTRIIQDDIDETIYEKVKTWTIEALRHWILDEKNNRYGFAFSIERIN